MIKELYRFVSSRYQNVFLEYKIDPRPRYGHGWPAHKRLAAIISLNHEVYASWLVKVLDYLPDIQNITYEEKSGDYQPFWNNGYLPGLDIIMLYTLVCAMRPGKYVEIGSGHSTRVVAKAKKDKKLLTRIVCIDPSPRAEIDTIADAVIKEPLENIILPDLVDINPGDIVFVDNSHRILPNSDSMVFFMEILPELPKGVIVHLHDVYLPYDYPPLMCKRYYSEQYGLAINLMANPDRYKVILPNFYISQNSELNKIIEPIWQHGNLRHVERHGGSFWIEIS